MWKLQPVLLRYHVVAYILGGFYLVFYDIIFLLGCAPACSYLDRYLFPVYLFIPGDLSTSVTPEVVAFLTSNVFLAGDLHADERGWPQYTIK